MHRAYQASNLRPGCFGRSDRSALLGFFAELGLTQQRLADIADLTVTAVAMAERGERAPSLDTAMRLCWALDIAAGVTLEDWN